MHNINKIETKSHLKLKPSFFGEGFVSLESIVLGIANIVVSYNIISDNRELSKHTNIYQTIFLLFQIILILYCTIGGYKFYSNKKKFLYYNSLFLMFYGVFSILEFIVKMFFFNYYLNLISSIFIIRVYFLKGIISGCSLIINGLFILKHVKLEYFEKALRVSIFLVLISFLSMFLLINTLYSTFPYANLIFSSIDIIGAISLFIGAPLILYSTTFLLIQKLRKKRK